MEMTVGERLIGGFSGAAALGARIEELARRASEGFFVTEAGLRELAAMLRRGENGSGDREVSLWDRGADGFSRGLVFDYQAAVENIVMGAVNGYAYDDEFGEYERDILESRVSFGNGAAEASEKSEWFRGAAGSGYLNVEMSAADLYYGLGGAEDPDLGLVEPPNIAFGAEVWNSSSPPRLERVDNSAAGGLMFGADAREASSAARLIRVSGYSEVYGAFDMPQLSGDELVSLRNGAARGDTADIASAEAENRADGVSGAFGGESFYGGSGFPKGSEFLGGEKEYAAGGGFRAADVTDYDDIIDYLVNGVKVALESGAEGVFG